MIIYDTKSVPILICTNLLQIAKSCQTEGVAAVNINNSQIDSYTMKVTNKYTTRLMVSGYRVL